MDLYSLLQPHPDAELLETYVMGRLGEPDTDELQVHLLVCDRCSCVVDHTTHQIAAIKHTIYSANKAG